MKYLSSFIAVIGYALMIIALFLSSKNAAVSLALVIIGALLLLGGMFANSLWIRKTHISDRRNFGKNGPFKEIDSYCLKKDVSYAKKIAYINNFYKGLDSKLKDSEFVDNLGKRELFLEENLRNDKILESFLEKLILSVLLPFMLKAPFSSSANELIVVFIGLFVYFIYYVVILAAKGINANNKLDSYEIDKIKELLKSL